MTQRKQKNGLTRRLIRPIFRRPIFRRPIFRFLLALLCLGGVPQAQADDGTDLFHDRMMDAYQGYRAGLFYLRTGNPAIAGIELAGSVDQWRALEQSYAAHPPAGYVADKGFGDSLRRIGDALALGLEKTMAGDVKAAQEILLPLRDRMGDLRASNGFYLHADCINDLNGLMDKLYRFRHKPPDMTSEAVRQDLTRETEAYIAKLAACKTSSEHRYGGDERVSDLFDGTRQSIESLLPAIEARDPTRVVNIIRELRSFDRMLFLTAG